MSTNIKLKRSAVAGKVPLTADLELGELAINTFDGKLYMKKDDGSEAIVDVTAGATDQQLLDSIKNVDGTGSGLDADFLDGQQGSYYLDWTNVTNKPDPTVTLTGAVTGSATMTDLGSISITTTATSDPTLTINGDASGSATFTNLGNATLTLTVADDSHNHVISNVDGLQTALDSKVDLAGDTMSGDLTISKADASVTLNDSSGSPTDQGIRIRAESIDTNLPGSEGLGIIVEQSPTNGSPDTTPAFITTGEFYAQSTQKVFHNAYHPNADKWTTARTLTLSGAVTGSASIDGSGNVSLATTATSDPTLTLAGDVTGTATFTNLGNATLTATVANDSHNHTVSTITDFTAGANTAIDNRVTKTFIDALNVDADTLDGEEGSYYLDWTNVTNKPDPTLTINGDASGSATFTNLGNATLSLTIVDDSHNHVISNIDGLQNALDSKTTESYVDTQISNLVDSSPATLDTLNELAAALGDDPNFATTVSNQISTKANSSITISAGGGLTGGGNLTTNRTISHADTSAQASLTSLTGANVVSDIDLDTYGHVTNLSTRAMTPGDIGAQPAGTYNTIIGTDSDINTSGSTIIDNIFVTDGVITSMGARTLTLSDLGYTGATNADNYNGWDLLTDGTSRGRITSGENVNIVGGTNVTLGYSSTNNTITINAAGTPPNNATITLSAGAGLTGGGNFTTDQATNETITVNHADTSTQGSVNNSGGTVIQDVTLDGYGHVTNLNSKNLSAADVGALGVNDKAADSNLLDGINSTQFLRSDANDSASGNLTFTGAVNLDGDVQINSLFNINAETGTTTSTTQTAIATFAAATYSSAKFVVQATDGVTSEVHVTEILVVHDGTTASATEYGTIHTGSAPLATYDVDISGGNVRLLASAASTNSTTYKVTENLITA